MSENYTIRDEIRDYWSTRAATFDQQVGHEIFSDGEREAWRRLLLRHLGPGKGRRALDLAAGTGVVSHLLHGLDFDVTGLDWSEAMLDRARAKARARGAAIRFVLGDAEDTREPPASYDVVVTRHLVWTLVDPPAAFREWHRVLRPGGVLLVVDGDFVSPTWVKRLIGVVERWSGWSLPAHTPDAMRARHERILRQVHFSSGARARDVAALLGAAGFGPVTVDTRLGRIHREQARHLPVLRALDRATQHRYAVVAVKPAGAG